MNAAEIKQRLSLRDAARMVGVELPLRDGVKFCSPLRPDRKPSCTIQGEVMRDWSRGESFDCIAFYATAKGISNGEAIKALAAHLGGGSVPGKVKVASAPERPAARQQQAPGALPQIIPAPDPLALHGSIGEPEDHDFEELRASRLLPENTGGLELAYYHGVLRFGVAYGFPCWLVTDRTNRLAVARRLDGKLFPATDRRGEKKALSLPKPANGKWPAGLVIKREPERLRAVPFVMVEGGPDLLAAYCILARFPSGARDVQPVAMLSASWHIPDEALPFFAGRPGVILAHGEKAGREAAERWGAQLSAVGCRVTRRHLPDGKDINDLVMGRTNLEPLTNYFLP